MKIKILLTLSMMAIVFCCLRCSLPVVMLLELVVLVACAAVLWNCDLTQIRCFREPLSWLGRIYVWGTTVYLGLKFWSVAEELYPNLGPKFGFLLNLIPRAIFPEDVVMSLPALAVAVMTMPVIYALLCWCVRECFDFLAGWDVWERRYFVAVSAVWCALLLYSVVQTSVLVYPIDDVRPAAQVFHPQGGQVPLFGSHLWAVAFFDADNFAYLYREHWENWDAFRHPFYTLAVAPLMPAIKLLGWGITGVSGGIWPYGYSLAIAVAWSQIMFGAVIGILLKRLCQAFTDLSFALAVAILYSCSFPFTFVLVPERLVLTGLTAVAMIYAFAAAGRDVGESRQWTFRQIILSLAAVGTTLLSALLVTFVSLRSRKRLAGLVFIGMLSVLLLLICVPQPATGIAVVFSFTPEEHSAASLGNNLHQYLHFCEGCVLAPDYSFQEGGVKQTPIADVPSVYILVGLFFVLTACAGAWFYRKEYFVQVAFFWMLVSFGILGIVGFGANNDEMVL